MTTEAVTVETVSKRVEANRKNAQKSCGPRTTEGKTKVRLNALKHGLTATTLVLPGEPAEQLQIRIDAWKIDLGPRTPLEHYLVERTAVCSWQLDRADRALTSRLNERVNFGLFDLAEAETEEVEDLARQLFWDPRGPIALYPHFRGFRYKPRVSGDDSLDDPIQPGRIVNRLASLAAGCRWLLDRWAALRRLLEDNLLWQAPDRLRAIRLLGRQPMDALADERVLMIYLACDAMEPTAPTSLDDLLTETTDDELKLFKERVKGRGADRKKPASPEAGKAALIELIEQAVAPLAAKMAAHRAHQEFLESAPSDFFAFDDSPEGELIRRYRLAKGREFNRLLATYYKVRANPDLYADDALASLAVEPTVATEAILVAGPDSIGCISPAELGPGQPIVTPEASMQYGDAILVESMGCAGPGSAPSTLSEPAPAESTRRDETKPNPDAEEPARPLDPEHPSGSGGESGRPEGPTAAPAGPASAPLSLIGRILGDLNRRLAAIDAAGAPGSGPDRPETDR